MIYSQFDRELIENVQYLRLAIFLVFKYNIPFITSKKIIIDHSNNDDHTLNKHEYEDIMFQLYTTNKTILANRIEIFKSCDSNKDGYIDGNELPELFSILEYNKHEFREVIGLISIEYCMQHYDKNNDNYLNFLDFNQYMNDTYYFHYK